MDATRKMLDEAITDCFNAMKDDVDDTEEYAKKAETLQKLYKLKNEEDKIHDAQIEREEQQKEHSKDRINNIIGNVAKGGFSLAMLLTILHVEKTGTILSKGFSRIPKIL